MTAPASTQLGQRPASLEGSTSVERTLSTLTSELLLRLFFFPDCKSAMAWTAQHPDTKVISIPDAFELGCQMVAARWSP